VVKVEKTKPPIKIGVIAPMTGDLASYGQQAEVAGNLAVAEINSAGGINGRQLEIITEDGQCDPKAALNAANKLILVDKVPVILPFCSAETLSSAPIAEQNKIVSLSSASTNPKITDAGDYIFRLAASDSYQGKFVAEYIYQKLNKKKVAILFSSDSEWSSGVKDVFKQKFLTMGGEIVAEEGVLAGARDYRSSLTKIKNANPELIYFPGMENAAIVGIKQIKEMKISVPIIGGDVWDDVKIPQTLGAIANGVQFTVMANKQLPPEFINNMEKDPRGKNVNTYSARFYDGIQILADIMRRVGDSPDKIKNELYQLKNYQGIADTYTMDQNGDLTNANYVTKEFRDGNIIVIK
jgi:branched-chain amino acid transport system substrate-binding protein